MSPSAVPTAVKKGSQSVTKAAAATTATGHSARCFPRHAPSAARTPRYPLSLAVISRFTVAIATEKIDRPDKLV